MTHSLSWFLERDWSTLLVGINLKTKPSIENTVELEAEDDSALYEGVLTSCARFPKGKCIGYGHLGGNNYTKRVDSDDRDIMITECPFGGRCPAGASCKHRHNRMSTHWHQAEPYSSPKNRVPAIRQLASYFSTALDSESHVDKDKASLLYNADWSEYPERDLHMFSALGRQMYYDMYPHLMHPIGLRAYNLDWMSAPIRYFLNEMLLRAKALHCNVEDELMRRREAETMPGNQIIRRDRYELAFLGHETDDARNANVSKLSPGFWTQNCRSRFGSAPGDNWNARRCPWNPSDGGKPPMTTRRRSDFFEEGTTPRTLAIIKASENLATAPRRNSAIDTSRRAPHNQDNVEPSGQHIYGNTRSRPNDSPTTVPTPPPPPSRGSQNSWGHRSWPAGTSGGWTSQW